eukprot:Nk52_evm16s136 gene=Nk52_evmTU16s136
MYIKQITIQGFKSYRDQTVVEPFSPKHNVVVGRNGSGKSNFFYAIRFVLSDMFSNMRADERQSLLHEGAGMAVMSAYVEVVFDNSDNRIPIDRDEVVLRRTIGLKKDEYFLDKKHVQKSDVMNLLESAGFSRSNPYYIVQQGKINSLALSKDSERLQLLKEVAGTSVYDERRMESTKIMEDSASKQEKIEEVLTYIETRLSELEEEKEELKEYQRLDRDRRSLEYTIYDKELRDTRAQLEKVEEERRGMSENTLKSHSEADNVVYLIEQLEKQIKGLHEEIQKLNEEKSVLDSEKNVNIKQKAKLELDVRDLEESINDEKSVVDRAQSEVKSLEKEISQKEKELGTLMPKYQAALAEEKELSAALKADGQRRDDLYAKQGRSAQFKTKAERDAWIKGELTSLTKSFKENNSMKAELSKEIAKLEKLVSSLTADIDERRKSMEERKSMGQKADQEFKELKQKRDEMMNERKAAWKEDAQVEESVNQFTSELNKAERTLQSTMSKSISTGLNNVKRIAAERSIPGVYGPLIELFECDEKFMTAVEVTAGNSLFHVVVDTDDTAARILNVINREKLGGRVTFMPLNRLSPRQVQYPDTEDCIPITAKLEYDCMFRSAIEQVFGQTLVCRNMDVANKLAKEVNLDCITLDGDQVNRKGALTGGYYDSRRSRLEAMKSIKKWRNELDDIGSKSEKIKTKCQELDQSVSKVLGDLQKIEARRVQLRDTHDHVRIDLKASQQQKQLNEKALKQKAAQLESVEQDLTTQQVAIDSLKKEMASDLHSKLTAEDQQTIQTLNTSIKAAEKKLSKTMVARTKLENEKNVLENLLETNLKKRRDEAQTEMERLQGTDAATVYDSKKQELSEVCEKIKQSKLRREQVETKLKDKTMLLNGQSAVLEQKQALEREKADSIQGETKKMEKLINQRTLLLQKKEENMRKIRDLGSLPSEAFEKYQNKSLKVLYKQLQSTNNELKKYSHVNKKALDQFVSFSDQREELLKRKGELDSGKKAILELIEALDMQKDAAIQRTFKQVSKYFSEVFSELVPNGRASLVMQLNDGGDDEESESEEQGASSSNKKKTPKSRVDSYKGVTIRVTFTGKDDETHFIQQLSGGQKSMVALCLIFAIQRCDPAPFYLFDEIDQALDSAHRASVARMIHRLSENAQFITTTFRPEFLQNASKCYAITFKNKVSHCDCITTQRALDFIEEEASQK